MNREYCVSLQKKKKNMAIKILSAKKFATKLKATIHRSGKLGFGDDTANALELKSGKFARFAQDDETGVLYFIVDNKGSEDAFTFKETSGFFSIATRQMFDTLGYDYEHYNIMFDLSRQSSLDADLQGQVYQMKPRINKRKEKKDEENIIAP